MNKKELGIGIGTVIVSGVVAAFGGVNLVSGFKKIAGEIGFGKADTEVEEIEVDEDIIDDEA